MNRLTAIRDDLLALGAMAPFRAVYEVGKRTGAHGVALRTLAHTAKPARLRVVPQFRPAMPVPESAVTRCLEDARRILHEGHRAFGIRIPIRCPNDWNSLGDTGMSWSAEPYWWQIDIRTDRRLGDVKWTWELGRHRDLVVLARAAFLEPDGPWRDELAQRLRWWYSATPAEHGIHWYSNLEIALRAIAWVQIYALCSTMLPTDILEEMALHVGRARRHLLVDFLYTASSMRNNHLLGDALGLLAIESFTGGEPGGRLGQIAEKSFSGQIERHMRTDGSMIEDSLSYHRFVMEMLVIKVKFGDPSDRTIGALRGSALHLWRLGVLDGPVPQWGDWDEGRVLASSGSELDLAGSTALGLLLTESASNPQWGSDFDEVVWYGDASTTSETPLAKNSPPALSSISSNGGITRVTVRTSADDRHMIA